MGGRPGTRQRCAAGTVPPEPMTKEEFLKNIVTLEDKVVIVTGVARASSGAYCGDIRHDE